MTVVEGRVAKSRMKEFHDAFSSMRGKPKPVGWKQSLLLQDPEDPEHHRLSTTWESREALERYRASTAVPVAFALFRSVGVEPKLHIFQIQERITTAD